jgi:flagellar M-ring protein FliF
MNFIQQFIRQFKSVLEKLDPKQKLVVVSVCLGSVGAMVYMMMWAGQKEYVVLASNLDPRDAQMVIERLEEQGVEYHLETDGTAILVPEDEQLGLRLEMAAEGLTTDHGIGYEIFDRPNLGLTDYVQKLNFRRSLEGELARTIRSLDAVDRARVSINLPAVALFREDRTDPTAAVFLTMIAGAELDREQVSSISKLISYSVEGLSPRGVTIVDQAGNDLGASLNKDQLFLMTANQLEVQREVESNIQAQVESQLATALGPMRSIVRVSAEMDFSQSHKVEKQYNPESQVVRSEDRAEASTGLVDSIGAAGTESSSITNFEMNETLTETQDDFGRIKRLHVSVTVDTGRTVEELADLGALIQATVGFTQERGDVVEVREFPLDTSAREAEVSRIAAQRREELTAKIFRYTLLGVAGIVLLLVLRSIFKSLDMLLPKPKPKPAIDIEAEAIEEEISAEAQRRAQMLDQVAKFAKEKPENVASLLNTWLLEEGGPV